MLPVIDPSSGDLRTVLILEWPRGRSQQTWDDLCVTAGSTSATAALPFNPLRASCLCVFSPCCLLLSPNSKRKIFLSSPNNRAYAGKATFTVLPDKCILPRPSLLPRWCLLVFTHRSLFPSPPLLLRV